eukprot:g6205.t1
MPEDPPEKRVTDTLKNATNAGNSSNITSNYRQRYKAYIKTSTNVPYGDMPTQKYIVFQRDIQSDSQPRRYGGPLVIPSQDDESNPALRRSTLSPKCKQQNYGWIKRDKKK